MKGQDYAPFYFSLFKLSIKSSQNDVKKLLKKNENPKTIRKTRNGYPKQGKRPFSHFDLVLVVGQVLEWTLILYLIFSWECDMEIWPATLASYHGDQSGSSPIWIRTLVALSMASISN